MMYRLPETLTVCGQEYGIRWDFRDVLDVLEILNDTELDNKSRSYFTLLFFYTDFESIPPEGYQEAIEKCNWFLSGGHEERSGKKNPRLMDWKQDFPYIIAPVNRVLGFEARAAESLHWWTFLGAYMEIGECTFAQIVHIRDKKRRGKTLDKADREWYAKNRDIVDLKTKYTSEEEDFFAQFARKE